ncbi:hypothetical protein EBR77_01205, partial [bacterium]|nr:hypothetical protein [bacterium]
FREIHVKIFNTGKLEIIVKTDFDKNSHEVLKGKIKGIDKGSISRSDLIKVSKKAEFINTKTSMKLIGKVSKEDVQEKEKEAVVKVQSLRNKKSNNNNVHHHNKKSKTAVK